MYDTLEGYSWLGQALWGSWLRTKPKVKPKSHSYWCFHEDDFRYDVNHSIIEMTSSQLSKNSFYLVEAWSKLNAHKTFLNLVGETLAGFILRNLVGVNSTLNAPLFP